MIHPAGRFVEQLLELARQAFTDLAGAALDLAPVAGLDLQALRETPLETAQGGGIGVLDGGGDEFFKQEQRIVQTDLCGVPERG